MSTPIFDFVKNYVNQSEERFHMPGHKGKDFLGIEQWDITEIEGADVLYSANGIIKQSEENAAKLFGTEKTFYSTEGSSLCIRAMTALIRMYALSQNKKPLILAGRNAHKTFINACAVLDIDVEWMLPPDTQTVISCDITPLYLEEVLKKQKPVAVYVTSPDYLGNVLDIKGLAEVCRKYNVLLAVDNAHGAYLRFLPESYHPIEQGADICCDSAHKTLPVLTGGAYLHISTLAPELFKTQAEMSLSLFSSTSPSYLILQSLDKANEYLSSGYKQSLAEFIMKVDKIKKELRRAGYQLFGNEPLKITVAPKSYGYTGNELADILLENGIVCEFSDPDFMVVMLTPEVGDKALEKFSKVLTELSKREPISIFPPKPTIKEQVLSFNGAVFSKKREIEAEKSQGMVLAVATVSCPPAVPFVMAGERIDESAVKCFKYYGIKTCKVVDK